MRCIISTRNPDEALVVLRAEKERRIEYIWEARNCNIPVSAMSDKHLDRAIKMLEHEIGTRDAIKENIGEA